MDASTGSTDTKRGHEPGKPLVVGDGISFPPNQPGKVASYSVQTFNGSQTMNSHNSGSVAPLEGAKATSGTGNNNNSSSSSSSSTVISAAAVSTGALLSKGLTGVSLPPSSNSVIQTPLMNSDGVSAASQAAGPTVTLVRPPMQTAGSGTTLNGSSTASPAVAANGTNQTGIGTQNPPVNSGQPVSAGSHIVKAEPPTTIIQSAPQPAATAAAAAAPSSISAPRPVGLSAAGAPGITAQMLAPRLPQTSPGQTSVHNIQIPPGMVLVRSESGQLLMIPQQTLAQMQAQAQGGMAPRTATATNVSAAQVPGTTIIGRQVSPGAIIRPGCPPPVSLAATTALHRPPVLPSSVGATVPGLAPRTLTPTPGTTVTSVTVSKETMENVKKCKNFLSTLIKLASSGKQSTETAATVRELVKDLLEDKLEAEEFTSRLYKELNSSPQPYLVPFLKRSLPALRQLTPDSAAFIQQSQLPQPASVAVSSTSGTSTTVVLGSPGPRLTTPGSRPQLQPTVSQGQTTSLVLQPQQQRAMLRPQVTLPTTPMMALRNQTPGRIMVGQQQVQLKELQPAVQLRPEVTLVSRQVSAVALTQAQKNKLKEAGGTFKDDDDINDVASMAGVNLSEESANILATNSGLVGAVTHSCKDEAFLSYALLQRRMLEIGMKYGVTELGTEVVNYVSHATQQRLLNLLEKVSHVAQQKNINFKQEDDNYEQSSDVRAQLKFFEQLDQLEKQRKEEQEREILLKAAKSRARQEDPEQLRLKQKAKEMQQQELAQMRQREANLTALAAIGPRKKKKNLDSPSSSASAEGSGTGSSLTGAAGSSGSRLTRQRITRVNLRDLLFCLENERFTSRSHFLYKGFLK